VHERLEAELRDGGANGADVVEGVLAREHHALDPELGHDARAALVVHRHLRGAVDLEAGIDTLDQSDDADVLDDRGVHAEIYCLPQKTERLGELGRLEQDVEGEVDPAAALVREPARFADLRQGQLRAFVTRIEAIGAQIHRIRAIGERGTNGVERARGGKQLRGGEARHEH
jgi:hypothetical protein